MKVQVYAYDLTRGMAAALSPMLLGYQIEAVWHTGVVIDGRQEIFFGYGINNARAGSTMFGQPARVLDFGETEVTQDNLNDLLSDLAARFRPQDYNLLFHNCNTFSNELVQLLTGESLPDYIMGQAQHLFNTPWGESLMPMIMAMEGFTGGATAVGLSSQQQQQHEGASASGLPTPAAAAPAAAANPAAAAAAALGSAAAVEADASQAVADAAAAEGDVGGGSNRAGVSPATAADSAAATAAANAGLAAIARATQQQQQQDDTAGSSGARTQQQQQAESVVHDDEAAAAAAAVKAAEGVAGLKLTADSRAAQQQQ